jgi:hypothetical protein
LALPELKASEVPFAKLPAGAVLPAVSIDGTAKLKGDDVTLSALKLKGKAGTVEVSGAIRKALSGKPEPDLDVKTKLDLPALTAKDLPAPGVPADFALPPSKWDVSLSGSLSELKIRTLRVQIGQNDVEIADARVSGLDTATPLFSVLVKCRKFSLDELRHLTAATDEMKITGGGFFALEVTGRWPKPILAGKAQFKDVGATVSGLPLSAFTGTASFDERRIDVPNLRGKVGEGELAVDLTIKDYAKRPDVILEANLTQFDLGKLLAAKAAIAQKKGAQAVQKAEEKRNAEPIDLRGRLTVGKLIHPNADAQNLKASWELTGYSPDFKHLGGKASVHSNGGKFTNLGALALQSKLAKVLIAPLIVVQKIGGIGGLRLLPDLNNVTYSEIAGDYSFREGIMTLNDSRLAGQDVQISATGRMDLPRETLDMTVIAQVGRVIAPLEIAVGGTFDKPQAKPKIGKLLTDPAKQLLQNIFKPK